MKGVLRALAGAMGVALLGGAAWASNGCPCDGDVDGDGSITVIDINIVINAFQTGCVVGAGDPLCDASDINCDGVVDLADIAAMQCLFQTPGDPTCCGFEPPCPCIGDLNDDATVDLFDFAAFVAEFGGPGPLGDIDCDGDVDYSDFAVFCNQYGSTAPFETWFCDPEVGACCWAFDAYPGGTKVVCQETSWLDCTTMKGRFVGAGTTCATVDCEAMPVCMADLDGNNTCDVFDFGVFATNFGQAGHLAMCDGDFDGDGVVTVFDFSEFTGWFGCDGPPIDARCCGQADDPPPPE